jgi:hypothetical protein
MSSAPCALTGAASGEMPARSASSPVRTGPRLEALTLNCTMDRGASVTVTESILRGSWTRGGRRDNMLSHRRLVMCLGASSFDEPI